MLDMVLEGINLWYDLICMVCVGEWTYHWTIKSRKKILLATVLFTIGTILYFILQVPYKIIFYVFEIVACCILCKVKLKDKIFKLIALFFIIGTLESMIEILIDLAGGYWIAEGIKDLINVSMTLVFFRIISEQSWCRKLVLYCSTISWGKSFLVLCAIFFGQVIIVFGNVLRDEIGNRNLTLAFRIVFALEVCAVIGVVIWLIRESYQKKYYLEQNSLKEEYIRTQQEYYQTIYEKDKELRSFRHDVANQISLLQMMLEQNDVEGAKEHLNHISQNFSEASFRKVYVGNEILDAILSMMCKKASDKGVQIEIEGELQDYNARDSYELCGILSNAISNAVEACEEAIGEKKVTVKLANHNQTLYLKIQNPASKEMYQAIIKEKTTKADSDNHGYGVRNIKHAVERLHGSMEYQYRDGNITLEIYI